VIDSRRSFTNSNSGECDFIELSKAPVCGVCLLPAQLIYQESTAMDGLEILDEHEAAYI
jgi:hypothetical protein